MRYVILAAFCGLVCSLPQCFGESPDKGANSFLDSNDRKLIAWFDSLGFPDLTKRQFVRIPLASIKQLGDENATEHFAYGFLLENNDEEFKVLSLELVTTTYVRNSKDNYTQRYHFEKENLQQFAEKRLRKLRAPAKDAFEDLFSRLGSRASKRVELFVLARKCAGNGLTKLAHDLISEAARRPNLQAGKPVGVAGLQATLNEEIAHSQMWLNVLALGQPSVSRPELLKRFRDFIKRFPQSGDVARAKATVHTLEQMVKEDLEHAKKKRVPLDKMTTEQRVAELIYQLRDQKGYQFSQPGYCNIFTDPRDGGLFGHSFDKKPGGGSPASQLVEIGYDAVPQLIEHLNDSRFTRSLEFHRDFYFSHHVLRVDHCAVAILERISGRQFFVRRYNNPVKDGGTEAQIKQWWSELQEKGEKQVLIEATSSGREIAVGQARKLLKKYPDVALDAIIKGAKNTKNTWTRIRLIELAANVKGEGPVEFLLEQLNQGATLSVRVTAARALLSRRPDEAVAAAIAEWHEFGTTKRSSVPHSWNGTDGVESLIVLLATCNRLETVRALNRDFGKHPVDQRLAVVAAFGRSRRGYDFSSAGEFGQVGVTVLDNYPQDLPGEVLDAIEELLLGALSDTAEREGMSGQWGGKRFAHPRVCDFAAHVLADRWKGKYEFELAASLPRRDRQRVAMQNVWRKQQGLSLLPLPAVPVIPALPNERIQPLLKALSNASSDDERKRVVSKIEVLGLPALPPVAAYAESVRKDNPAEPELMELVKRLGCTVSTLNVGCESVEPTPELRALLDAMKNKPLTSEGIVELLVRTAGDLPSGATGIKLAAERTGDGTGVYFRATLTKDPIRSMISQEAWNTIMRIDHGGSSSYFSVRLNMAEATQHTAYGDLSAQLNEVLCSDVKLPFSIRISCIQNAGVETTR